MTPITPKEFHAKAAEHNESPIELYVWDDDLNFFPPLKRIIIGYDASSREWVDSGGVRWVYAAELQALRPFRNVFSWKEVALAMSHENFPGADIEDVRERLWHNREAPA